MTEDDNKILTDQIRLKANQLKAILRKDPKFSTNSVDSSRKSFDTMIHKDISTDSFTGQVQYREYYDGNVNPEIDSTAKSDLYIFGNNQGQAIHFTEGDSLLSKNSFGNVDDLKLLDQSIDSILNSLHA